MKKFKPIQEQVIVITGASSGIGLATAFLAAEQGAKVVLASRNLKDLNTIVKEIKAKGGDAVACKCDVSRAQDVEALKDFALKTYGTIDTWVNNAGVSIYGRLLDLKPEEEKKLFETNFWGITHGCKVAVEALRRKGGVIINLGSEVSQRAIPLQGLYSASKHAVKAYTDALRMELEHDKVGVAVCLVRPTAINTPFPLHAKNRLRRGVPKLPKPVYEPRLVAEAILKCATSPQRDVYVGGTARLNTLMDMFMPRLADKQLIKQGFRMQVSPKTSSPKPNEALMQAPKAEGKIHGVTPQNEERHHSFYTTLTTLPLSQIVSQSSALGAAIFKQASRKLRRNQDKLPAALATFMLGYMNLGKKKKS